MEGKEYEKIKAGDDVFVGRERYGSFLYSREVVARLTATMIVLEDGSRYYRASGERVGRNDYSGRWRVYPVTESNCAAYQKWLENTEREELAAKFGSKGRLDWQQLTLEQLRLINTMLAEAAAGK